MSEDTKSAMMHEKRYNKEISDYVNYITPKEEMIINIEKTINILKKSFENQYPEWEICTFGSYKQNISTIFSDLNITINTNLNTTLKKKISIISKIIQNNFTIDKIITNAIVPIIKARSKTGIKLDISVDNSNGVENAMIIMNTIKNKKFRNIMIILKILLKNNNKDIVYFGGMNSFLLFHLFIISI